MALPTQVIALFYWLIFIPMTFIHPLLEVLGYYDVTVLVTQFSDIIKQGIHIIRSRVYLFIFCQDILCSFFCLFVFVFSCGCIALDTVS